MKLSVNTPCPCHSGRKTKSCCGPTLKGRLAPSVEALMRSRYAAYAVGAVDHIIHTTHADSPHFDSNTNRWNEQVRTFCQAMAFTHLTIHSSKETDTEGQVHFTAGLSAGNEDHSFSERSLFYKVNDSWMYHSAMGPHEHPVTSE